MKKFLLGVILCACLLMPIPVHGQLGTYNTLSHITYCPTQEVCEHEFAHHMDQQQGWISQSPEFKDAIQMYLYMELRKPILEKVPATIVAMIFDGNNMSNVMLEIYANLYMWADGQENNMPNGLRKFYNWTIKFDYQDGQSIYWLK